MLERIITGVSAVAYVGAFVLGLRYVLEVTFRAETPIIMRAVVIVMAVIAFLAGYFSDKEADKSGKADENNAN